MFGRGGNSLDEAMLPPDGESNRPGKGRPTPKRSEAERGRRRVAAAPLDRKEAIRRNRDAQRAVRARSLLALKSGDERHLPMRDRGPVRAYVRDVVDSRRSVGEFFLPLAFIVLILTWAGTASLRLLGSSLWLVLVALILVDGAALLVRLRRGLAKNMPDEKARGALPYGLMRSMQIRRFRLPPPKVKPGGRRRATPARTGARVSSGGTSERS